MSHQKIKVILFHVSAIQTKVSNAIQVETFDELEEASISEFKFAKVDLHEFKEANKDIGYYKGTINNKDEWEIIASTAQEKTVYVRVFEKKEEES